jgi:glyoxylase-like metal-dependent hydrolase (beta-lactamase superfamily II)
MKDTMKIVTPLGSGIFQLELVSRETPYRTSGYLICENKVVLIETGSSASNPALLSGLKELDLTPGQVDGIIVTHIHLDHAGGAGLLMSQCPNARLFVHEKGMPHLVDPQKLIDGARLVYGSKFDSLFNPIVPVPAARIQVMPDNSLLDLGNERNLKFLDTPGHSFHHFAIHDSQSNGLFSGDSTGLFFQRLFEASGIGFCLPATAPTQFAPDLMIRTLDRLLALNLDRIYFTHFGMAQSPSDLLNQAKNWTTFFGNDCPKHYQIQRSYEGLVDFIQIKIAGELERLGVPADFPEAVTLYEDIKLNAQGIIAYVKRLEKAEEK